MKNKTVFALLATAVAASVGIFALCACDQRNDAVPVESSDMRQINLADDLRDDGLRIDRVQLVKKNSATVYARYEKPFSASVILAAFDRTGNEIGRSKRTLAGTTDEAGYFDFGFDSRVPMKSASYFSLSRASAETAPAPEIPDCAIPPSAEEIPADPAAENVSEETVAEPAETQSAAVAE